MADQRLFVTQEGSLFQGGSGNDSIHAFTGTVSGNTVQGLDGNDLIQLGNETEQINLSGKNSVTVSAGAGSAGTLTLTYSGNFVSGGVIANASTSTSTSLSAGAAELTLSMTEIQSTGIQSLLYATVNGNAGNDTVVLGDQLSSFAGSLVGGGQGNDYVGTYNWGSGNATTGLSTAGQIQDSFSGNTVNGGKGNDTVFISYTGSISASQNTLNGNQGNDSVSFSSTTAAYYTGLIGGGQGEDTVYASFNSGNAWTINGGAGNDSVHFDGLGDAATGLIQGDTTDSQAGNDTIHVTFSGSSAVTVKGLAGADSIYVSATTAGGTNLIEGGAGNDSITFGDSASDAAAISAWTINGGAGADLVTLTGEDKGVMVSSLFDMGAGDDTITMAATAVASAGLDGTTINGGAGADKLSISGIGTASGRVVFGYAAYSDSTLASMDTITIQTAAISAGNNSGYVDSTVRFSFSQGGIALASGAGSRGSGLSATGGMIVWSSFSDTDLTARVSAIDASYTTTGNVAIFTTDGTEKFMFVQGGSTDTVIKLSNSEGLSAGLANAFVTGSTAIGF